MLKRLTSGLLTAALILTLCGCAGIYEKEYISVSEYSPPVQESGKSDGKVTVKNFAALKQALLGFAYAGETEGVIVFDQSYEGDTTADMASACWQVRTQDALCAYCVENIAYELNKIVTINEASVYISYSAYGKPPEEIQHLSYSTGVAERLRAAMEQGERYIVLLISRSAYNAAQMENAVRDVYRENPTLVPKEPTASVNMFSGTGTQRLYEITISYGMTDEEKQQRTAQLEAIDAFAGLDTDSMSEGLRALTACQYLVDNCALSDQSSENTAYAALVNGQADSEGIAFAYMVLCKRLQLDCRIVYGQHIWSDSCWNIVRVDGSYYHVDVAGAKAGDIQVCFLRSDEEFWGDHRWDVASYPKCVGELRYDDILFEQGNS